MLPNFAVNDVVWRRGQDLVVSRGRKRRWLRSSRTRRSSKRPAAAHGIWAMPSARALLVASLLTEPPYGCLGPSGDDRYRKRRERCGLRKLIAKSRLLFRILSANNRRVSADVIGGSTGIIRAVFVENLPLLPSKRSEICLLIGRSADTSSSNRGRMSE